MAIHPPVAVYPSMAIQPSVAEHTSMAIYPSIAVHPSTHPNDEIFLARRRPRVLRWWDFPHSEDCVWTLRWRNFLHSEVSMQTCPQALSRLSYGSRNPPLWDFSTRSPPLCYRNFSSQSPYLMFCWCTRSTSTSLLAPLLWTYGQMNHW